MNGAEDDLEQAREEASLARARLVATMGDIQARLNPHTLLRDVAREVRDYGEELAADAVDMARRKPIATTAIALGLLTLIFREPIWKGLISLFWSRRATGTASGKFSTGQDGAACAPGGGSVDEEKG